MIWSPDTALKAYLHTVQSELLSAMAAGWNASLIVDSWSHGDPLATSVGLSIAARYTRGRHVCLVPDERSRSEYLKSVQRAGGSAAAKTEVIVGEAEEVMAGLAGVDFVVVDCKRRDFVRVLRFAKLSHKGAVMVRKNAYQSSLLFRWQGALGKGTRVVRSVFLPVGKGLDVAHIECNGGVAGLKRFPPGRWIKFVDQKSGEEHVFRG